MLRKALTRAGQEQGIVIVTHQCSFAEQLLRRLQNMAEQENRCIIRQQKLRLAVDGTQYVFCSALSRADTLYWKLTHTPMLIDHAVFELLSHDQLKEAGLWDY